jgi:hypothetical protein
MLAYVFWHWPTPAVDAGAYEAALAAFHQALADARLRGVHGSVAYHVTGAPWLPEGGVGYEDWYRVEGFADLDTLNTGAVAGACEAPHAAVARLAAGGTAGLYRRVAGQSPTLGQPQAVWLGKPAGMAYAAFFGALAAQTGQPDASLWQRQMTLGPTPEFCLLAPGVREASLPTGIAPIRVTRRPVWPPRL